MTTEYANLLRAASAPLELSDVLKLPPTEMLGVSAAAGVALGKIGVQTVFDLGASSVFAVARAAANAGDPREAAARHGQAPGDWLIATARPESLEAIGALPLESLAAIPAAATADIKTALDVATISEFANWPPHLAARRMIGLSVGGEIDIDERQTEALRPRFGEYPTERVYYSTLVMLDMNSDVANLIELDASINLVDALSAGTAFKKPAVGALVTLSQSWYAQGITLGQMVHSLALAPGEATRIAVIDWSRTTKARASESINEAERLASETGHQRALSEVQESVANEMQAGGSTTHVESRSRSGGIGLGLSAIVPVGGALIGGALGGSYQGANTTTDANSTSWSSGSRSVTGSMTQTVNDRTEQHSTFARNRRATAVREVSQSEHEEISTRIVANYNHMHALTIQYYEVVQVYRISTEVQSAERVLFIPVEPADFDNEALIDAFRGVLAGAALTGRARDLMLDPTSSVEIRPAKGFRSALFDSDFRAILLRETAFAVRMARLNAAQPAAAQPAVAQPAVAEASAPGGATARSAASIGGISALTLLGNDDAVVNGSMILARPIIRPGSSSLFYSDEVELVAIQLEGLGAHGVSVISVAGGNTNVTLDSGAPTLELTQTLTLGEIREITIKKNSPSAAKGAMRLHFGYRGRRFVSPAIPVELPEGQSGANVSALRLLNDSGDRKTELKAHLKANRAHYSAAIFRSLDSATIAGMIAKFKWNGKPLANQVEPKVISVAGNFLVLRAPVDGAEASGVIDSGGAVISWDQVLRERKLTPHTEKNSRMVPIPTDGVFAEAVLGRSNSAEKLDITRFWNWQDSPAPLTPPELAPVASGSRGIAENLTPGQLGPSTLNIVNPTNLPDPAGLGAAYGALAGLNFRDMSGLAGTQGLAGTATSGTLTATTEAGKIAHSFAATAADVVKTAIVAGYGQKKEGGVSGEGARVNHGRDLDERKGTGGGATGGSSGDGAEGGSPGGSGGGGIGGGTGGSGDDAPGFEETAFNQSVGAPLGGSLPDLVRGILGGQTSPAPGTKTSRMDRPAAIAEATKLINSFRSITRAGKWHATLDRKKVGDRLEQLINDPTKINQGSNGLCGEAAFFNIWLWEDPLAVTRFAVQLYSAGAAAISGDEQVRPRQSLLDQDFSKVVSLMANDGFQNAADWSADWMMMSALRDANNYVFKYDGTSRDQWGVGSSVGEMADWLDATKLFRTVDKNTDRSDAHNFERVKKLVPNADAVMILCDSHILGNTMPAQLSPNHWIVLKSAVVEDNGKVDFKFWSWGVPIQWVNDYRNDPANFNGPPPGDLTKQKFIDTYFGHVVGRK